MYVNEVVAPRLGEEAHLAMAEKMHRAGVDLDTIYDQTGWFPGPDAEFRTQVSDESFRLTGELAETGETTVGQAVEHDELFDLVPEVADTPIVADPNLESRGAYMPDLGVIAVRDGEDIEAVAHEIEHDIQQKLKFPGESRGTSPEAAGSDEAYRNNNGEIEAEEVARNIGSTPQDVPDLLEKAKEEGVGPGGPSMGMG